MNESSYITLNDTEHMQFVQMPKALYFDEKYKKISTEAKVVYSFMLDRTCMSKRNGWVDESGRVYIFFTVEQIVELINCSHPTAVKILKELDKETGVDLIERVKRGNGKADFIYVKKLCIDEKKDFTQPVNKFNSNNTELNNTKLNIQKSISSDPSDGIASAGRDKERTYQEYAELISNNIDLDVYVSDKDFADRDMYEEIYQILCDEVTSEKKDAYVEGRKVPREILRSRFLKLNSTHLMYVINCVKNVREKIMNIKSYLISALYNATCTISSYYAARVSADTYCGSFGYSRV